MEDLNELINDIDNSINDINMSNNDIGRSNNDNVLYFSPDEVSKAIKKLKVNKHDGGLPLTSDNILNSTCILNSHLALLFSAMVKHGFSPNAMLVGTMVSILKSRWKQADSNN